MHGSVKSFASEQPPLGVMMLDTQFLRPPGDAGNPDSWPFPVIVERVSGAMSKPVVSGAHNEPDAFIAAGQRLVSRGACAVTTTCGFLVRQQRALESALGVPVCTSTLLHASQLQQRLSAKQRLAILTIDKSALDESVRRFAGIADDVLVFELPTESHFRAAILDGSVPLNPVVAEREWVQLALRVQSEHPDVGYWLFECANMPPYSRAVAQVTGVPVFDALSMGTALHQSVLDALR